jgi:hypothetical protein
MKAGTLLLGPRLVPKVLKALENQLRMQRKLQLMTLAVKLTNKV